jgi:hypothetical protein
MGGGSKGKLSGREEVRCILYCKVNKKEENAERLWGKVQEEMVGGGVM